MQVQLHISYILLRVIHSHALNVIRVEFIIYQQFHVMMQERAFFSRLWQQS